MENEIVTINRNSIWLSYESVLERNNQDLLETTGYICYFNREKPEFILGESIKNDDDSPRIFNSQQEAKEFAVALLKNKIYPPSFLDPLSYDAKNISEIMHKPVSIEIGLSADSIDKTIKGKIIRCTSTSNDLNALASILVEIENGDKETYSIFEVQSINKL